jgi:hypothetical protein
MRWVMVDFSDDFRPTVSSGCLSSIMSEKYETCTIKPANQRMERISVYYVPGVRQIGYRLHETSIVLTAKISALFDDLLSHSV